MGHETDQIHLNPGMTSSVEIRQDRAEENPWNIQYGGSVCCGRMVGWGWHKEGPTPKEKTKVPGQKRGLKVDTVKSPYTGPGFLLGIKDTRQKPSPAEQGEAAWWVRSAAPCWALEYPELGKVWWWWRPEETQEFTCQNWAVASRQRKHEHYWTQNRAITMGLLSYPCHHIVQSITGRLTPTFHCKRQPASLPQYFQRRNSPLCLEETRTPLQKVKVKGKMEKGEYCVIKVMVYMRPVTEVCGVLRDSVCGAELPWRERGKRRGPDYEQALLCHSKKLEIVSKREPRKVCKQRNNTWKHVLTGDNEEYGSEESRARFRRQPESVRGSRWQPWLT